MFFFVILKKIRLNRTLINTIENAKNGNYSHHVSSGSIASNQVTNSIHVP